MKVNRIGIWAVAAAALALFLALVFLVEWLLIRYAAHNPVVILPVAIALIVFVVLPWAVLTFALFHTRGSTGRRFIIEHEYKRKKVYSIQLLCLGAFVLQRFASRIEDRLDPSDVLWECRSALKTMKKKIDSDPNYSGWKISVTSQLFDRLGPALRRAGFTGRPASPINAFFMNIVSWPTLKIMRLVSGTQMPKAPRYYIYTYERALSAAGNPKAPLDRAVARARSPQHDRSAT